MSADVTGAGPTEAFPFAAEAVTSEPGGLPFAERPLRYEIVEDALLVPSATRTVYRGIDAGVFDAALLVVEESLLTRTWRSGQISYAPDITGLDLRDVPVVEEPCIYGGYFFHQFGHFLLESLARTWAVEEIGNLPFVWATGGPPDRWQAEILSLLGLSEPQLFPRGPTRFRRLVVPEPGFRIQGQFHPRHARFLGRFAVPDGWRTAGRVWLSRAGAPRDRRSRGEAALEEKLSATGWRIVRPEALSVRDQLDLLCRAEIVAGLEGSAFHAAILLAAPCAPVVVLRRTDNANYPAIAGAKRITEFDLYGAFALDDRTELGLVAPRRWADKIDRLADRIMSCRGDPDALSVLRNRVEAEHALEPWRRRQRLRILARSLAKGRTVMRALTNSETMLRMRGLK